MVAKKARVNGTIVLARHTPGTVIAGLEYPHITFVVPSLQAGGAENIVSTMANYWVKSGARVTIFSMSAKEETPFYNLDSAILFRPLGLAERSGNVLSACKNTARRISILKRALGKEKPDLIISVLTETSILTILSTRGLGIPVIVAEHSDPYCYPSSGIWRGMRRISYLSAARIVVLNKHASSYFERSNSGKVVIIPNSVQQCRAVSEGEACPERKQWIVCMGRLSEEKGFDILLQAFSRVSNLFNEWRVIILGEGPQRHNLENMVSDLGVQDRVEFRGQVNNPDKILVRAGIFVLSSRSEAFPMGLCEAMSCGCPVIATQYHSGVFDLIQPEYDGLVVPKENVTALSQALSRLLGDSSLRLRLGKSAREIVSRYNIESVMRLWDSEIKQLA